MGGLVDSFWLWNYMLIAGAIGVALLLALVVFWCAKLRSREAGTALAAAAAWMAATWFAQFVRRHTRPRGA
jgi:hypothetical protein